VVLIQSAHGLDGAGPPQDANCGLSSDDKVY